MHEASIMGRDWPFPEQAYLTEIGADSGDSLTIIEKPSKIGKHRIHLQLIDPSLNNILLPRAFVVTSDDAAGKKEIWVA